jgi:uncharacterized protein
MSLSEPASIVVAAERLLLLPERALFWPRKNALIVADLHLGKAATLRAASLAVPEGSAAADLARLSRVLDDTQATQLLLLGDLLHARQGRDPATLALVAAWRERHAALEIVLVRGNHDRAAGDPPAQWQISCVDEPLVEPPFALQHYPGASEHGYSLAGHLHPAVQLRGRGGQRERLPCFVFGATGAILPAFGSFTGAATIQPKSDERIFVVADQSVIQVQ